MIATLVVAICGLVIVGITVKASLEVRGLEREATRVVASKSRELVERLLAVEHGYERHHQAILGTPEFSQGPPPTPQAWTPLEREVLGVNDTIALIARIDAELTPTTWTDDEGYVYKMSPGFGQARAGSMPPC